MNCIIITHIQQKVENYPHFTPKHLNKKHLNTFLKTIILFKFLSVCVFR